MCWEHNKSNFRSFGWIGVGDAKARKAYLHTIQFCPTVPYSEIPPWKFIMPLIDLQLQEEIKRKSKLMPVWCIVKNYMELHFTNKIIVFTDGSKNPENGRTGAAVYIPQCEENIEKRTTDFLSVYTVELVAIILGLQWIERRNKNNVVVASDSLSALISIGSGKSCRLDILNEIYQIILRLHNNGKNV